MLKGWEEPGYKATHPLTHPTHTYTSTPSRTVIVIVVFLVIPRAVVLHVYWPSSSIITSQISRIDSTNLSPENKLSGVL